MVVVLAGAFGRAHAQSSVDSGSLVESLHSDDVRWNASRAMWTLREMEDPPIDELERALDSDDWQQRQLAACALWRRIHPWALAEHEAEGRVTRRLLEVTVEGLRHDALPYDPVTGRYTGAYNGAEGFRVLVLHAHEARELLEAGVGSDDTQQQLLCAMALGFGGVSASAGVAAPVLLPHLRDNDIPEDAKWCVHALYGFGRAVLPAVLEAIPGADEQQRQLLRLLVLDLESPPVTREQLERRARFNTIAGSVFDPAYCPPRDECLWWVRYVGQGS